MRFVAGAMGLLAVSAVAADLEPSFYAPFDGAPSATIAQGKAEASVQGKVSYVDGVRGKAVVCGEKGVLVFQAAQNFDPKQGALSVWARPVDWADGDGKFHFIFCATSEKADTRERLLLYKFYNTPQVTMYADGPLGKNPAVIQKPLENWNDKTWRHYVMCWTTDQLSLYVDGELAGQTKRTPPAAEDWQYFSIGRDGFTPEGGHCAFDELKIFGRPLTAAEVAALFSADSKKNSR